MGKVASVDGDHMIPEAGTLCEPRERLLKVDIRIAFVLCPDTHLLPQREHLYFFSPVCVTRWESR